MRPINLRTASIGDVQSIANLHTDSWRRHYRGAYLDSYLDGDILTERLAHWSEKMVCSSEGSFTIVAENQEEILGFAHTIPEHDAVYGALLDNLHVSYSQKRSGIGSALMREIAAILERRSKGDGLYLWVLEQNRDAQAFYSAQGGVCVGQGIRGPLPGGGTAPALRYHWPNFVSILTSLERRPFRELSSSCSNAHSREIE